MAEAEGQFLQNFGKDLLLGQIFFRNGESVQSYGTQTCAHKSVMSQDQRSISGK